MALFLDPIRSACWARARNIWCLCHIVSSDFETAALCSGTCEQSFLCALMCVHAFDTAATYQSLCLACNLLQVGVVFACEYYTAGTTISCRGPPSLQPTGPEMYRGEGWLATHIKEGKQLAPIGTIIPRDQYANLSWHDALCAPHNSLAYRFLLLLSERQAQGNCDADRRGRRQARARNG